MIIVAANITTDAVTLYNSEGGISTYPQGHEIIPYIIDELLPEIRNTGSAKFTWTPPEVSNEYKDFEEKSSVVKFFSMSKRKLAAWLGKSNEPKEQGTNTRELIPESIGGVSASSPKFDSSKYHSASELDLNDNNSMRQDVGNDTTLVAMVNGKPIPDAERLHNHIQHSNKYGNTKNVEAFLTLIADVIDKRKHSVEDLLRFIELGDLPIADDGYIVGYKALNIARHPKGDYQDHHTGNVYQSVGDIVCVPEQLVDDNRRRDCSNGLHFARRGYLRGFNCDTCVLVRVHPADFIAVPERDAQKCRVSKYHIVADISENGYELLMQGKALQSKEDLANLSIALSGKVALPKREVLIQAHRGSDIKYTWLNDRDVVEWIKTEEVPEVSEPVEVIEDKKPIAPVSINKPEPTAKVSPKQVEQAAKTSKPVFGNTPRTKIHALIDKGITVESAKEIDLLRKKAKKSLKVLGVSEADSKKITSLLKK